MTTQLKKSLMIGVGIFLTLIMAIGIVYLVRKPAKVATLPTPKPSPLASAVKAPIMVVDQVAVCSQSFVVACPSGSPSPSPSSSVSPSPSSSVSPSPSPSPSPSIPPSANLDCVAKRMYLDDGRNRAGFYYMEQEITDTNTLQNGQTILYNVTVKNTGGNSVPDTTITDKLSTNLTYVDGDSGCNYDTNTRVVTCTIGTLSPSSEAQRSFRAMVNVTGTSSVANTAEVSSTNGQRDSCSVAIDATGRVVVPPSEAPVVLPEAGVFEVTVGTVGVGLLLLIAGALGLLLI